MRLQSTVQNAKARTIGLVKRLKAAGMAKRRRRPAKPRHPLAIERAYAAEIARFVQGAAEVVRREIEPNLARWVAEAQAEARIDGLRRDAGIAARIAAFIRQVADRFLAAIRPTAVEALAERFAQRTNEWSKDETNKRVRAAVGVDVFGAEPNLVPLVEAFTAENVALIRNVPQRFLENVEGVVLRGVTSGTLPRDIAQQLVEAEGVAERRAALIARDQVGKFYGKVNEVRQRKLGGETFYWRTMRDNRVRPEHEDRDGVEYAWTPEDAKRLGVEYLPPEEQPGQPVNCFPGTTPVRSSHPVLKAYRRWFDGELTVLVTASGETLRATPNHPVWTPEGWLPAHAIEVGQHVGKAADERAEFLVGDPQRSDASIEEVFRAAASIGVAHRVAGAAAWFHGDGSDEQVDVVDVNRSLRLELDPGLSQSLCEYVLACADESALARSLAHESLFGLGSAPDRIVRGAGKLLALVGRGLAHPHEHGVTTVAWADTLPEKLRADGRARDAEVLRHALHAPTLGVELRDHVARVLLGVVGRAMHGRDGEPVVSQQAAQVGGAVPQQPRDFGEVVPEVEQLSRVVQKVRVPWAGHVYNLQTGSGWYVVHNLIVHNCRCLAEPNFDRLLDGLD